jgi:hypothetical protein
MQLFLPISTRTNSKGLELVHNATTHWLKWVASARPVISASRGIHRGQIYIR